MNDIFFSIIIPVYNVKEYLERCISSILISNSTNFEIILVDDGSTDGSGEICDNIVKIHNNIHVIHKVNQGAFSARNEGVKIARGKYISYIDADDWVVNGMYNKLYDYLQLNNVDIVQFGYNRFNNGCIVKSQIPVIKCAIYDRLEILNYIIPLAISPNKVFDYKNKFLLSACMHIFRREVLIKNKVEFLDVINEDPLYTFSAIICAGTFGVFSEILYCYEARIGSQSLSYRDNMIERKKEMVLLLSNLLKEYDLYAKNITRINDYFIDAIYDCLVNECRKTSKRKFLEALMQISKIFKDRDVIKAIEQKNLFNLRGREMLIIYIMKHKLSVLFLFVYKLTHCIGI